MAKQTAGGREIWSRGARLSVGSLHPLSKLSQRGVKAGETEAELNHFLLFARRLSDFFLFS